MDWIVGYIISQNNNMKRDIYQLIFLWDREKAVIIIIIS